MNKEIKRLRKLGFKNSQIERVLNFVKAVQDLEYKEVISEGAKVKLNIEEIQGRPDYKRTVDKYKQWIEENKNKTFTVEFDENKKDNPLLVCLKEDRTKPKWQFLYSDLEVVHDVHKKKK